MLETGFGFPAPKFTPETKGTMLPETKRDLPR